MKSTEPNSDVTKKMVADYENALMINQLLNESPDGEETNKYAMEWGKTIKERNAWLEEELLSFEYVFEKKYPKETMLFSQETNFQCFFTGEFSGYRTQKNTIGEIEMYYSIEANEESACIGFYLLLALYAYDGHRYALVMAKSKEGCDNFFPTDVDSTKLKICNQLLTIELIDKSNFTNLISFCEKAIDFVNEKINEKLIKNY